MNDPHQDHMVTELCVCCIANQSLLASELHLIHARVWRKSLSSFTAIGPFSFSCCKWIAVSCHVPGIFGSASSNYFELAYAELKKIVLAGSHTTH